MNASELYELLDQNKEKLPIIDRIMEYHPGKGTDLGWSWYIGGLKDEGDWRLEILLKVPYAYLLFTVDKWDSEREVNEKLSAEEELKMKKYAAEGRLHEYYKEKIEEERKLWEEVKDKFEKQLLWGKQ